MKLARLILLLAVLVGAGVVLTPTALAKSQTIQGTAFVDGAAVPDGTVVQAYRAGVLIGTSTTPITTQGTYRLSLSDVNDGETLTFKLVSGGLTHPADESKTLAASDPEPLTFTLTGHADSYSGVTKLEGVLTPNLPVKAFIAGQLVASTTSSSIGTYVLKVPGSIGNQILFTVSTRDIDTPRILAGGQSVPLDLDGVNHAPQSLAITGTGYTKTGTYSPTVSAADYDDLAGDTMTYSVAWGWNTAPSTTSGKASNSTYAPSTTYPSTGTRTLTFYANDTTNAGASLQQTVKYDAAAPTTTLTASPGVPNGNAGWWKTTRPTFTLTATDPTLSDGTSGSGISIRSYRWNNGSTSAYTSTVTSLEGTNTVGYWATDVATNQESQNNYQFRVDTSSPTGTISPLPQYTLTSSIALSWTTSDATSGWASGDIYYKPPGATTWTLWLSSLTNTSATFPASSDGLWSFYIAGTDVAGNSRAAPAAETTPDATTTVSTAQLTTSASYSTLPDVTGNWTTRPSINITANQSGTIHYAWNPNLTNAAWASSAHVLGGPGVHLQPDYGCNILSYYAVANGVTEARHHDRVCVFTHTQTAPADIIADAVWTRPSRTLTSSLDPTAQDVATAVWGHQNRSLTTASLTALDVWSHHTRTITSSIDPNAAQVAAAVWNARPQDHAANDTFGKLVQDTTTRFDAIPGLVDARLAPTLEAALQRYDERTRTHLATSLTPIRQNVSELRDIASRPTAVQRLGENVAAFVNDPPRSSSAWRDFATDSADALRPSTPLHWLSLIVAAFAVLVAVVLRPRQRRARERRATRWRRAGLWATAALVIALTYVGDGIANAATP